MAKSEKPQFQYSCTEEIEFGKNEDDIIEPIKFTKETDRKCISEKFRNIVKFVSEKSEKEGTSNKPKDVTPSECCIMSPAHQILQLCKRNIEEDRIICQNMLLEPKTTRISNSNIKPIIRILTDPLLTQHRSIKADSDIDESEHEINSHQRTLKFERKDTYICKSKSKMKKNKKKMDNLVRQLNTCSITESNKDSECNSSVAKYLRTRTSGNKKQSFNDRLKDKRNINIFDEIKQAEVMRQVNRSIELYIKKEVTLFSEKKSANQSSIKMDPFSYETTNLYNMLEGHRKKDMFFLKNKIQKCKERMRTETSKVGYILKKIWNSSNHERTLNSIIERLTAVELTEDVSTEIKKAIKPTQTHLTPV